MTTTTIKRPQADAGSGRPKSAARYRSLAATVRAHLLDASQQVPSSADEGFAEDLQAMRDLLAVGRRYRSSGSLDTSRSTPETIDLAVELPELAQGHLARLRPEGRLDMRAWTSQADHVLASVQRGETLDATEREFLLQELVPLLTAWMQLPATPIRE